MPFFLYSCNKTANKSDHNCNQVFLAWQITGAERSATVKDLSGFLFRFTQWLLLLKWLLQKQEKMATIHSFIHFNDIDDVEKINRTVNRLAKHRWWLAMENDALELWMTASDCARLCRLNNVTTCRKDMAITKFRLNKSLKRFREIKLSTGFWK